MLEAAASGEPGGESRHRYDAHEFLDGYIASIRRAGLSRPAARLHR